MLVGAGAGRGLRGLGGQRLVGEVLSGLALGCAARGCALHRCLLQGFLHDGRAVVDGVFGTGFVDALAGETALVDRCVSGDQDDVGAGHIRRAELVLRAYGALGFDLDLVPELGRAVLQTFGRHERVGNSRRAGGDRHDACRSACISCAGRQHLRLLQRGLDHAGAVLDRFLGARFIDALAGEAAEVHRRVGGDQHDVGGGDVLGGQLVLRSDGALGFDLDRVSELGGSLFQPFGCHECVRYPGGTGRYRYDVCHQNPLIKNDVSCTCRKLITACCPVRPAGRGGRWRPARGRPRVLAGAGRGGRAFPPRTR